VPRFRLSVWGTPDAGRPSWEAPDATVMLTGLYAALTAVPAEAMRRVSPCTLEAWAGAAAGWEPAGWLTTWVGTDFLEERAPHWWGRAVQVAAKED
jgi:hypothetical protein